MTREAAIFPGQGAQVVGMGCDISETSGRARSMFDRANDVLGFDIADLCFNGPGERLGQTDIQQPAIFVTSAAIWEAFLEGGGSLQQFDWTGGLSLGEYTALYIAKAVSFDDALRLVRRRGQLMQAAAEATPSGMVSLIGADETMAVEICTEAAKGEVLAPANFNCPGQIVISGTKAACERVLPVAEQAGCRAVALAVAGAFHSPLMQSAADELVRVLAETEFSQPEIKVVANVNAEVYADAAGIRDSLSRQVTEPVLWQKCIQRMIDNDVERFVEFGPGRVLTGLMRKIDRNKTALSVRDAATLTEVLGTARTA